MQFLSQYGLASVPAMRVLHRHLQARGKPMTTDQLRNDLQPVLLRTEDEGRDKKSDVVASSLLIGKYLGLFAMEHVFREDRWRAVDLEQPDVTSQSRAFASVVLRRLGERAVEAPSLGEVPDLTRGLTAMSMRDPATPYLFTWDDRPGTQFGHSNFPGVTTAEQWRFFRRWAISLGLANHIRGAGKREFLGADPSQAITDVLHLMDARDRASAWFRRLFEILPILGAPQLMPDVPGKRSMSTIGGSVALAVRKLGERGRLEFLSADDSSEQVDMTVAGVTRRIGEVRVLKEAT